MMQVYLVTGLSGAGKSTALRALEDFGFFCVDNLPIALIPAFFQFIAQAQAQNQKIALGVDVRSGSAINELIEHIKLYKVHADMSVRVVFLGATTQVLLKRFQETRRKHPLGTLSDLYDAIEQERKLLQPLRSLIDYSIDTDQLTIHQLRNFIKDIAMQDKKPQMVVNLTSFGFKYGVPAEPNYVFDTRSLPNPFFITELEHLDGTHEQVQDYLLKQEVVRDYIEKLSDFITYSLKRAHEEGRFFVHIAIGCTGGRHRSVALVEKLATVPLEYVQFVVKHRDIEKR